MFGSVMYEPSTRAATGSREDQERLQFRHHLLRLSLGSPSQPTAVKLDPSPFVKPAQIRVLLVPVHPIKRSKFDRHAALIRRFSQIKLADVPPDARGERAIFSSSPSTPGTLLFDYLTPAAYASSHSLAFLSEFQIHRRVHGIIGILDSSEYVSTPLADALAEFQAALKDLPRTFATKVYAFEPNERQLDEGRGFKEGEGLIMIPGTGDIQFYLGTVLADFASQILWEFSNTAAQLESRVSIPTPQESTGPPRPFAYISQKPNAIASLSSYAGPVATPVTQSHTVNLTPFGVAPPPQSRTASGPFGATSSGNQDGFLYGMSIQSNMALQPASAPSPPPGALLVDQKARKRVVGREKKLMADLWLLAGRLGEAIACYNDAISQTKSWQDSVWQASALEGLSIALVLQAAAPKPPLLKTPSPAPGASSPALVAPPDPSTFLSSIPDRLSQAISLYGKMLPPPPMPSEDQPPPDPDRAHPFIYTEACLRCARFLLSVLEHNGSIDRALQHLVRPELNADARPRTSEEQARSARWASLSPSNTVPRSSIATWVSMAYGPHLASLAVPLRLRLTGEIASLYGRIGYRRKESFVLRELAALCAEGVAGKGIEVFTAESLTEVPSPVAEEEAEDAGDLGAPSKKPTPRISPLLLQSAHDRGSIVRTTSDSAGNESIIYLAEKVCEAFGIAVVSRGSRRTKRDEKRSSVIQGRPLEIMESGQGRFGWPALQVGVLGDAINIAEALPDYQAAIRLTVTALRTLSDSMPSEEQYRLSQNIPRIFAAATRRGAAFDLEYWGPTQLVMSLEVAPLSPNRLPHEHPFQDTDMDPPVTAETEKPRNPFIYNPSKGPLAARARPTLVQNEIAEVYVTLQNPFLFGLEIQSLELSTSGVPFAADALSTVVPPGSFHTVRLSGTPLDTGMLVIRGCNIRLAGCMSREFVLPVWSDEEEAKRQKAATLDVSRDRIKLVGLEAFSKINGAQPTEIGLKFLECTIVPELPMLWMRSTSLTHGALVLYDGEISTIRIGLENTSSSPIDFVKLSFSDTHTASMQAYLDEDKLSPAQAYEIYTDNSSRPVFSWSGGTALSIAPGASAILEVQCRGKVGCDQGSIRLDYAYVDRQVVRDTGVFHTRQMICDVFMTVHRSLVAHSLEILRLKALPEGSVMPSVQGRPASVSSLGRRGVALDRRLETSLRDVDNGEHCLALVDVMNAYGQPFEVALEHVGDRSATRQRLEPGATARLLVRMDRFTITEETLAFPIPSLGGRQFVVSKVQSTAAEHRQTQELFWYREELLSRLRASWSEVGSLRTGEINLRNLKLTPSMLDVLRSDDVDIHMSLCQNYSVESNVFQHSRGRQLQYTAIANEFMDVCVRVTNNSSASIQTNLRVQLCCPPETPPSHFAHLSRYVVIDGVGSNPLRILAPGESESIRLAICLLAEGLYEFRCVLEEVQGVRNGIRDDSVPRRWHERETLAIHVEC